MGKNIGAIVGLLTLLAAVYSGATQMFGIADEKYVSKPYFKSFEARQFVSDLNDEIEDAEKDIRIFEYKLDSGSIPAAWEVRQYEEAKKRKQTFTDELNKFLNPIPANSQSPRP